MRLIGGAALNDQPSKSESQPESGDTETMSALHGKSANSFDKIAKRLSDLGDASFNLPFLLLYLLLTKPKIGVSIFFFLNAIPIYLLFVHKGSIWDYFAIVGVRLALVAATFWGCIVCFVILHIIISLLTGTRLRPVQIFISFKHDYESIAAEIEKGLNGHDIQVIRLPFRFERDHDEVISESLRAVTAADALVVVPGRTPSWMANELGHAVASNKPIAVIKHLPDQGLSDSLYRGYPVFTWDRLHTDGLAPLRRFLVFATKARGDIRSQFYRCTEGFWIWIVAGFPVFFLLGVLSEIVFYTWAFATADLTVVSQVWWVYFALATVMFAAAFIVAFCQRLRGLAVARQKILTRDATFEEFSRVFSLLDADKTILSALERAPL
jgi:hypothetical protein